MGQQRTSGNLCGRKLHGGGGCAVILIRNSECCGRSPAAKETNFPLWMFNRDLQKWPCKHYVENLL